MSREQSFIVGLSGSTSSGSDELGDGEGGRVDGRVDEGRAIFLG